jgi:hypothetical protein
MLLVWYWYGVSMVFVWCLHAVSGVSVLLVWCKYSVRIMLKG